MPEGTRDGRPVLGGIDVESSPAREKLDRKFQKVLGSVKELDDQSRDLLTQAYEFSMKAHEGQMRLSGDPFITHGLEVASILAELNLDPMSVAAGILHDVVEDTGIEKADVERKFGSEIASLVEGLTELQKLSLHSPAERQVESARRMLISMVSDVRVIFIKLADRLHNMRTLQYLPAERIEKVARETLEIYAPLAHRLGMGMIKSELEDLSFKYLDPERYEEVSRLVEEQAADSECVFESFREPVEAKLRENGIKAKTTSRIKHTLSVWNKMLRKGVKIDDIFDILSVRIITESVRDCYYALEIVHSLFTPVHERFKDYIAAPKSNMYQSIHTTVMNEKGNKIEVQIRTERMNYTAEYGLAAHWIYKDKGKASAGWDRWLDWFKQTVDYQLELTDPAEFFKYLKTDLFQKEIFVFTPAGELKQLPTGSTPIDFAYAVHSAVGNRCKSARVNGRLVPLDYTLKSGDRVEILTSSRTEPSEKWLQKAKTSRARSKIRHWLRTKTHAQEETLGKELLRGEFRKRKIRFPKDESLRALLPELGKESLGRMYTDIASGRLNVADIAARISPGEREKESETGAWNGHEELREIVRRPVRGIKIEGLDNILVRFARCCQPVPGDSVVAVITRGRGASVHRVGCRNVKKITEPGRVINVEWDAFPSQRFLVSLIVTAKDSEGLISEISRRVKTLDTDVQSGKFEIHGDEVTLVLVVRISNLGHLQKVVAEIGDIENVLTVHRAI
jgi:GTP pyrophosphokinase